MRTWIVPFIQNIARTPTATAAHRQIQTRFSPSLSPFLSSFPHQNYRLSTCNVQLLRIHSALHPSLHSLSTHTHTHDSPPLQRLAGNLHTQSLTNSLLTQPPTSPSSKSISLKAMPPSRHHTLIPPPPKHVIHPPSLPPPPNSRPRNESVR